MFQKILDWFEDGDLVPLAVIISVAHYGPVLMAHGEHWAVAWAVGVMIDLLHFRSVRYAFSSRVWIAGLVAVATSVMAVGYHLRFYDGDWLLALPIPIGIGILAWHASEKERGVVGNAVAAVRQELDAIASTLKARESELADVRQELDVVASELKACEIALAASEKQVKSLESELAGERKVMSKLGPLGKDMILLVGGAGISQAEIAARHGLSESSVSRLKASLNGGG